jgi:hypothetical protein
VKSNAEWGMMNDELKKEELRRTIQLESSLFLNSSFRIHHSALLFSVIIDQRAESAYADAVHEKIKGERFKALNL